jgi:molybdopterin-containing oxidoreductase family iron-sulfur binding subunit
VKFVRNPMSRPKPAASWKSAPTAVQRIRAARSHAAEQGPGRVRCDGEVLTACQQACPADAIVFGDMNDPEQPRFPKLKSSERNYGLLEELNTRPRTTLPAAVSNPNPELESGMRRKA